MDEANAALNSLGKDAKTGLRQGEGRLADAAANAQGSTGKRVSGAKQTLDTGAKQGAEKPYSNGKIPAIRQARKACPFSSLSGHWQSLFVAFLPYTFSHDYLSHTVFTKATLLYSFRDIARVQPCIRFSFVPVRHIIETDIIGQCKSAVHQSGDQAAGTASRISSAVRGGLEKAKEQTEELAHSLFPRLASNGSKTDGHTESVSLKSSSTSEKASAWVWPCPEIVHVGVILFTGRKYMCLCIL